MKDPCVTPETLESAVEGETYLEHGFDIACTLTLQNGSQVTGYGKTRGTARQSAHRKCEKMFNFVLACIQEDWRPDFEDPDGVLQQQQSGHRKNIQAIIEELITEQKTRKYYMEREEVMRMLKSALYWLDMLEETRSKDEQPSQPSQPT